ncbi:hypothetical protein CROQUDRAFT_91885 [Cronartium quercuum f. sp. fusiforme G11]|uniref:Uncharacterized protein n=1 Tax=Cronartium quercuum f. sp. fusiforme G11 TaxID=708437 RepID=A0A9P6NHI2_9BASI|nr:hypothetical protein CROQUDRAFT_91885 [Cronartium quercuum f. sp. fusiforme G11]
MLLIVSIWTLFIISTSRSSLFITSPNVSTNCVGGKICEISWNGDKLVPIDLSVYGIMMVGLWYRNVITQPIELLIKVGNMDPKVNTSMSVIIPPNIGPNGNNYFIRMDQVKPTDNGQPYQVLSSRFTLSGMNGVVLPISTSDPPPMDLNDPSSVLGGIITTSPPSSPTGVPMVSKIDGTSTSLLPLSTGTVT